MDFREFSKAYNSYLCHAGTGNSVKFGSKAYNKSGRRRYGSEVGNMRPKDYIAQSIRNGFSKEEIISNCESVLDPRYGLSPGELRFYHEVIKILNNERR